MTCKALFLKHRRRVVWWLGVVLPVLGLLCLLMQSGWLLGVAFFLMLLCGVPGLIRRGNRLFVSVFLPVYYLAAGVLIAIVIRVFFFEVYSISSGSMQDALGPGSVVVAEKLSYGPVMPDRIQAIPFLGQIWERRPVRLTESERAPSLFRLSGFHAIKRNDVVLLRRSAAEFELLIKRCVGMPGDTFRISGWRVYVNSRILKEPGSVRSRYVLYNGGNEDMPVSLLNSILMEQKLESVPGSGNGYSVECSADQLNALRRNWKLDSVRREDVPGEFGPVVIPRAGDSIQLTPSNREIYGQLIRSYEPTNDHASFHRFKYDYYCVLGDNRNHSLDSREFGLIPSCLIQGKALVVFSKMNVSTIK